MSSSAPTVSPQPRTDARAILALAIPALGALVAEPLFILVDSAFVGHVSTAALAGLSIASTILTTVVGLAIFLAYSTTAAVARAVGAGNMTRALTKGIDATWLASLIGLACALVLGFGADVVIGLFGPRVEVAREAATYLRISAAGLPAMLMIQAALGLVRGLQDTRITLIIAAVGAALNVPINWALIFGLNLGIAGSAIGTLICQWGMAAWYIGIIVRGARRHSVSLAPNFSGVNSAWREGRWLFIRSVTMRIVLLTATAIAIKLGEVTLAAHQLMNSVFSLTALALDSLAIAAQALTGKHLGAGDRKSVESVTRTLVRWSFVGGLAVAAVLLLASFVLPQVFTPDPAVQRSLAWALVVLLIAQPLAGYVFVLDGVSMGAGDARDRVLAGLGTMGSYLPFALGLWWVSDAGLLPADSPFALALLWAGFTFVFLASRAATLWWRGRSDAWMHLEEHESAEA